MTSAAAVPKGFVSLNMTARYIPNTPRTRVEPGPHLSSWRACDCRTCHAPSNYIQYPIPLVPPMQNFSAIILNFLRRQNLPINFSVLHILFYILFYILSFFHLNYRKLRNRSRRKFKVSVFKGTRVAPSVLRFLEFVRPRPRDLVKQKRSRDSKKRKWMDEINKWD